MLGLSCCRNLPLVVRLVINQIATQSVNDSLQAGAKDGGRSWEPCPTAEGLIINWVLVRPRYS